MPSGAILVDGVNFDNPISIQRNRNIVVGALNGTIGELNRQWVATQLSLAFYGGTASPVIFNVYWSPLRCSGLNFAPVTLSNGVTLSSDSLLDTLVMQVTLAIKENRSQDFSTLAAILAMLNERC